MREFQGKVAVVTGAASGIGRAMAARFAVAGMSVVLADIEREALDTTARALRASGASVLAVPTDVADGAAVEALAQQSLDRFGAVHVLCNNAGVSVNGPPWELTVADWEWVLGVNLWGVIHGIRVFVPIMLAQHSEAHVVNTASGAGLVTSAVLTGAPYAVSKYGVVGLSEVLVRQLALAGAQIGVSLLCPGFVQTNIGTAARNRPARLQNPPGTERPTPAGLLAGAERGLPPAEIAAQVFDAIQAKRFYVLPDPGIKPDIRARLEAILGNGDLPVPLA